MSASITIERQNYRPGEEIRGTAKWKTSQVPRSAQVRLFWRTQGKGVSNQSVVETLTLETSTEAQSDFSFKAPGFPYSFSGKLISLTWGVELVMEPEEATSENFSLSPDGTVLDLQNEAWLVAKEVPTNKFRWPAR